MKIEVYSDVVCPWCYIGERRLARALASLPAGRDVEVVYRPYQLDPHAPATAVPLLTYLEGRFGPRAASMAEGVTAVGRGEGITFAWDKALAVNTRTAHRLLQWVEREYGAAVQRAVAERLFALHFTDGGNLGNIDELVVAAAPAGVDPDRARAHVLSTDGIEELDAAFDHARALGIRAVPTFVINERSALQGAQPVSTFVRALEQALEAEAPRPGGGDDACADGTCAVPRAS